VSVTVEKDRYYETSLCYGGRLGLTLDPDLDAAEHDLARPAWPGVPVTVDFLLSPGAEIAGRIEGGYRPSFVDVFGAEPKQTGYADLIGRARPDKEGRFSVTVRPGPVWFGFGGSSAGEPTSGRVDLDRVGTYALVLEATGGGLLLPEAVQVQVLRRPADAATATPSQEDPGEQ
jgi:hypothetical protein